MVKMKRTDTLLRRFAILYVVFAVLPFLLIYYIFTLYDDSHTIIKISYDQFTLLTLFLGVASLGGYFGMRTTLNRFVVFTENIKKSVLGNFDSDVMFKLASEEGEVGEIAKSFTQIIKRLDENVQELEEKKKTIHNLMTKVSNVLSSAENLDNLITLILDTATDALGVRKGIIFSFENGHYNLKAKVGLGQDVTAESLLTETRTYLNLIVHKSSLLVLPAMGNSEKTDGIFSPPLICAPLCYHGKTIGALLMCGKRQGTNFSDDEMTIASNLSNQIAIAFENARLNADIEQTYFETMAALAMAVEARDPYSRGHSDRVGEYAQKIGIHMGLSEECIKILRDASRLHDVGKIGIMDSILTKEGTLNNDEADVMKQHPTIGESILMPLKTFRPLLDPVRHHHENLVGSGYPDGLSGEAITPITRILTIADIYDALTTDRPYRKAMDFSSAKKELDSLVSGGKIDGDIVNHLYHLAEEGGLNLHA